MKLRVLALVALAGALVPVWAADPVTHDVKINRQRITTVLNAPGGVQLPLCTKDVCINRQRITTVYDLPGMVRGALPIDRQFDRSRIDTLPAPKRINGGKSTLPAPKVDDKAPKPAATDKEEVRFQDKGKAPPAKGPAVVDRAKMIEETVTIETWRAGRTFKDNKGRSWCLMHGDAQADVPATLRGWIMQAEDSPILFFSRTGRLWKLVTQPLP